MKKPGKAKLWSSPSSCVCFVKLAKKFNEELRINQTMKEGDRPNASTIGIEQYAEAFVFKHSKENMCYCGSITTLQIGLYG